MTRARGWTGLSGGMLLTRCLRRLDLAIGGRDRGDHRWERGRGHSSRVVIPKMHTEEVSVQQVGMGWVVR